VHRSTRSQEIAFESSDGDAGLLRTFDVIPKHRYTISAWGIHFPSPSPIELDVGVDLTGGLDSRADTVDWYPWLQKRRRQVAVHRDDGARVCRKALHSPARLSDAP
jgi:hypothetical protein